MDKRIINVESRHNSDNFVCIVCVDKNAIHHVRQQLDRMFPSGWHVSAEEMATIAWHGALYSAGWYSEPANI